MGKWACPKCDIVPSNISECARDSKKKNDFFSTNIHTYPHLFPDKLQRPFLYPIRYPPIFYSNTICCEASQFIIRT